MENTVRAYSFGRKTWQDKPCGTVCYLRINWQLPSSMLFCMSEGLDIYSAQFVVQFKTGPSRYRLGWPKDRYYGLVKGPIDVLWLSSEKLLDIALEGQPNFLNSQRLTYVLGQFEDCAEGRRPDWPALPVLVKQGEDMEFIDGRHRCTALANLGAATIPVLVWPTLSFSSTS